jgi:hypothetical protein
MNAKSQLRAVQQSLRYVENVQKNLQALAAELSNAVVSKQAIGNASSESAKMPRSTEKAKAVKAKSSVNAKSTVAKPKSTKAVKAAK